MKNKELTALEAFNKIQDKLIRVDGNTTYGSIIDYTNLKIIEKALKRLEEIDKLPKAEFYTTDKIELDNELDKKLKALEIIKSWLSDRIVRFDEDLIVIRLTNNYCNPTDDTFYYYIVPEQEKEQIKLLKEVLL